jgi:hypothetical protein
MITAYSGPLKGTDLKDCFTYRDSLIGLLVWILYITPDDDVKFLLLDRLMERNWYTHTTLPVIEWT